MTIELPIIFYLYILVSLLTSIHRKYLKILRIIDCNYFSGNNEFPQASMIKTTKLVSSTDVICIDLPIIKHTVMTKFITNNICMNFLSL